METEKKSCCSNSVKDVSDIEKCPVCNFPGEAVKIVTVESLVKDENCKDVLKGKYFLCKSKDCDVIYYNSDKDIIFLKDQVKVPIWYKKNAIPKYACYCSKTTEEEVIVAVIEKGARTVEDVIRITGAMENDDCIRNNPRGYCCWNIIQEVIDKALEKKEN
ncbi:MAG: (2Fe-2S)-binding protein [Actinobacteria bacterium]|nr:(2Fe-2S)-binding protein [Actinomycetota bacterium]